MVSLDKLDCAIVARRSLLELVYCLHDGDRCVLGPLTTHIPEITGHLHIMSAVIAKTEQPRSAQLGRMTITKTSLIFAAK